MKAAYVIASLILIIAAFLAGILVASLPIGQPVTKSIRNSFNVSANETEFQVPDSAAFIPVDVNLSNTVVEISSGCRAIAFPVTSDQAMSIAQALLQQPGMRPLTHDIIKDVLEGFNITILSARIEKFDNDIYYARMFIQQGNKVLDIDMRPSDAIAISLRTGTHVYANKTMLDQQGVNICTGV